MKNAKQKKLMNHFIAIALLIAMMVSMLPAEITGFYSYAAEGDNLYDTIPISFGTEGGKVSAKEITVKGESSGGGLPGMGGGIVMPGLPGGDTSDTTFYLVKLPENTTAIKFYGDDATQFAIPDDKFFNIISHPGKKFDSSSYSSNGWWTIDTDELKWDWFQNSNPYNEGLKKYDEYCPQATYFELENNLDADKHFFIQLGDENSPLDVLAAYEDYEVDDLWPDTEFDDGNGPGTCVLKLHTGKRHELIESEQQIYYTVDGTDPTVSETAVLYKEGDTIKITRSCTLKAAAKISDDKWGSVCSFPCTLESDSPVIYPESGSYSKPISITMNCNGADIYYTTDGTDPVDDDWELRSDTDAVKKYTEPFKVSSDTVVKAVSVKDDCAGEIVTKEYDFSTGIDISFEDESAGVWLRENKLHTDREATLVTPYGKAKCHAIVTVAEGADLKVNDKVISPITDGENAGKYLVEFDVQEDAELWDNGKENIIEVTNGTKSNSFKVYCIASKYADVPDKVTDYFVPSAQFTNNGLYGCAPNRTLIGKPGFNQASSLGNFGGYITWFYKDGIQNDSHNPYGVDFVVIGNSFDGTNEAAEPGNIMVSEDGEKWYTLAGSIHYDGNAIWNQKVSYTRSEEGLSQYEFENNESMGMGTSRFLYPDLFYYPLHDKGDSESFITKGTLLVPDGELNAYGNIRPPYPAFGYADVGKSEHCSNEAENPYGGMFADVTYGDRFTINRNGDACDIAWAVDDNGNPVKLDKIHYVKVQTASFIDNGAIGEKSTEVNCMRIAKPADSEVGVTAEPASIKIDGQNAELKPFETVDADVSGVFDIAVDAPETANVYINSIKGHNAFLKEAPHGMVRVIVQEGEKEPLIYYFKINQTADSKDVTSVTLNTRTGANGNLQGLVNDKDSLICYFDEDTASHFDGKVPFPKATAARENQAFAFWQDEEGNRCDAYDASMAELETLKLKGIFAKKADIEAAEEVNDLIDELPDADDVKAEDIKDITAAREAYEELTDDQKDLISKETLDKLEAAEDAAVDVVDSMIDELPDEITEENAEAVKAASDAFDALSDEQKDKIDAAKQEKLDQANDSLANSVSEKIDALPANDDVKLEDEEKIKEVRVAYDSLSESAKAKVANYSDLLEKELAVSEQKVKAAEDKLKEAEEKIKELESSNKNDKAALEKAESEKKAAEEEKAKAKAELEKLKKESDKNASEQAKAKKAAEDAKAKAESDAENLRKQNKILKKEVKNCKAKAKKGRKAVVKWKKAGKGFKYEVYRATNPTKKFKKVKTSKKAKVIVKKLKKGRTYFFKVRAFKKVNGKKVYTRFSNVAKAKIKK